jgi:protocatechuate 3,4-dioxygenase beta subunit
MGHMPKFSPTPYTPYTLVWSWRSLLLWSLGLTIAACSKTANEGAAKSTTLLPHTAIQATPSQTEGPFYPIVEQKDKDNDLTRLQGRNHGAQGETIFIEGRILNTSGAPLANALVEIWQANTWGRYRHQRDPNAAPLDPGFQGWGQTTSDAQGRYRFKTIKPGAYPAGPGWTRPPHIHFKVACPGYVTLITQMYFPAQPRNKDDLILQNLPRVQQPMLIAKPQPDNNAEVKASEKTGEAVFRFDIVLRKRP